MRLWIRGIAFTGLVPGLIGVVAPHLICDGCTAKNGLWSIGWLVVVLGSVIYALCLISFLASGGTPAIFFTRHLRSVIGEEPSRLVRNGLYRISRNPMYVGVLLVVLGQAVIFASVSVLLYGVGLWLCFHLAVVLVEEPHLRKERGPSYDDYCKRVPRWFGWPG